MAADVRPDSRGGVESAGRYRRLFELGSGSSGLVYAAEDRVRGHRVAVKALRATSGESLYQLKREFRQLAGLSHANIVELYDLVVEGGESFYTMELVDGVDFVTYCRGPSGRSGGFDETRLRSSLAQLAEGVSWLHDAGKVHRDIKPSNVLVTGDGRVVLLDFGLVKDLLSDGGTLTNAISGTALYMAPEQMELSGSVAPASDWYAVGVMLYEVLSGKRPFEGEVAEIARQKRSGEPPTLPEVLPADLRSLCTKLLARDASQRATGKDVLEVVANSTRPQSSSASLPDTTRGPRLVGREPELQALRDWAEAAADGTPTLVLVRGESGIGKTALVDALLRELGASSSPVTILRGRCREREHIPYRAIDGVIDHLSQHWRRLYSTDAAYLLPRDADLLRQLFPVLGRVSEVAAAPATRSDLNPQQRRLAALDALREVLHRAARKAPTVVFVDDFHWVDADTLALLRYVMRPPNPPPILLLLSARPDTDAATDLTQLLGPLPTDAARVLELTSLDTGSARKLAQAQLGSDAEPLAREVAREAGGNPFLVEQLARHVAQGEKGARVSVDSLVQTQLADLSDPLRSAVQIVCLAGEPLPAAVVIEATGAETLTVLLQKRLLRKTADVDREMVEPYHDRIRQAVAAEVSAQRKQRLYRGLAPELTRWAECSLALLAAAWQAAGDSKQALSYTRRAADAAAGDLAFEQAANLYQHCLDFEELTHEQRTELQVAAAVALANAGHGAAAAEYYLKAAEASGAERRVQLQFDAATQLLHSGRIEAGLAAMKPVLQAYDLRPARSLSAALAEMVATRAWIKLRYPRFPREGAAKPSRRERQRLELCWSALLGMVGVDLAGAVAFHSRALRLAYAAGDVGLVARWWASEGQRIASFSGDLERAEPALREARRLVALAPSKLLTAQIDAMAAGAGFTAGRPALELERLIAAERTLFELGQQFDRETKHATMNLNSALYLVGQMGLLEKRVELGLKQAAQTGDLYLMAAYGTGPAGAVWLALDDAEGATRVTRDIQSRWSRQKFWVQHLFMMLALAQAGLYVGGSAAMEALDEFDQVRRRSELFKYCLSRLFYFDLLARALISARGPELEQRRLSELQNQLEKLGTPMGLGHAAAVAARRAVLFERDRAPDAVTSAIARYEEAGMSMHAAAQRFVRGQLLGGDAGREDLSTAQAFFEGQGVKKPESFIAMLEPVVRWV